MRKWLIEQKLRECVYNLIVCCDVTRVAFLSDVVCGQMLREGNKFVLAIREVLIEDSGIFTCRAANPAGVAECSAELFVEGAFLATFLST